MFAIRYYGMWLKRDGKTFTSSNNAAMLFHTAEEAVALILPMKEARPSEQAGALFTVMEVTCKQVISKVGSVHTTL